MAFAKWLIYLNPIDFGSRYPKAPGKKLYEDWPN